MIRVGLIIVALSFTVAGCRTPKIDGSSYLDITPPFDIVSFFDGEVKAWGIVQDRAGNLTLRFEVDIDGTWQDNVLTLDETFRYGVGDGASKRVWRIRETEPGKWTGNADDILDSANGESFGNAFYWTYSMDLPVDNKRYRVTFKDWIWAFDNNTIVNRAYIRKFGITFAEVTLFMQKQN